MIPTEPTPYSADETKQLLAEVKDYQVPFVEALASQLASCERARAAESEARRRVEERVRHMSAGPLMPSVKSTRENHEH